MELSRYEKETIINFNEADGFAIVYTYNVKLLKQLSGLESRSPDCRVITSGEDFCEYKVPKSWIKIRPPRQYSEEQKAIMAERAKKNFCKE